MYDAGAGRTSRCHYHEQAPELPRATPEDVTLRSPDRSGEPVIRLRGVSKTFHTRGEQVRAVVGVDLDLKAGETLGLVGESGSGKTTLARVLLGLSVPDEGSIIELEGSPLAPECAKRDRRQLQAMQIVFQNPDSALNRRHSVRHIITRALKKLAGLSGEACERRLLEIVRSVRMEERHLPLRPYQLSGGLKQRVAIARAFAGLRGCSCVTNRPRHSTSRCRRRSSISSRTCKAAERVTYVFISHDLGVVRYLSDSIAVLYLGRVMEYGPAETVFSGPHHPYTESLLSAVPSLDGSPRERSGSRARSRAPRTHRRAACSTPAARGASRTACATPPEPGLVEVEPGHMLRCHIPLTS